MSEPLITQFRTRAERGLDAPDLAELERRGRALRRRRTATAVGAVVLLLAAGAGTTQLAGRADDTMGPASPPAPSPTRSLDDRIDTRFDTGEEMLVAGRATSAYGDVDVTFDVPGPDWEWWDVGMGLRRTGEEVNSYAAAVFFLFEPTARLKPCDAERQEPLGTDPDRLIANVTPLLSLAHSRVVQEPEVVRAFGRDAVHLRLRTDGSCPLSGLATQLQGVLGVESPAPEFDGALDLWHVVLPDSTSGSVLVASWELDGTERHRAERRAVLDSVQISGG